MNLQIVIALRPNHWIKNLLVLAAPFFAGELIDSEVIRNGIKAFLAFCLASSLGYLINDWRDREIDREHPTKKNRPFASNEIGAREGLVAGIFLMIGQVAIQITMPLMFIIVVNVYMLTTISYSLFLKNLPVVELLVLSFGFLLRPLGGAAAVGLPVSKWFLIVICFGSLFIGATKRYAEYQNFSERTVRYVLRRYTIGFLHGVITLSMTILLITYALWVFQFQGGEVWSELSLIPFTLGVLRYAWHRESEGSESPENLVFKDPILLSTGFSTLTLLTVAIYLS
jgi:decaprenyl-phosphate phosphoribosyltransferase